ncbi:MAG: ORF6N domain-containing protein [Thermodesulfovibrionales bacterium]|nr:ORF6N domain-containing protein [Thermodesulfovibrionales bacterium]
MCPQLENKNNPDKFLGGYILELSKEEKNELVENFHRFEKLKHSTVNPKAFTEKGLYMLATILKSPQATQTTIAIIETFAKIRNLSRNIKALSNIQGDSQKQNLLQKSGRIIAEILDDNLVSNERETTIELNFAVLKFKHIIKTKKEKK